MLVIILCVTLNLFQGLYYTARWMLKQVQHDKEYLYRVYSKSL